jgi:hypothetical protein
MGEGPLEHFAPSAHVSRPIPFNARSNEAQNSPPTPARASTAAAVNPRARIVAIEASRIQGRLAVNIALKFSNICLLRIAATVVSTALRTNAACHGGSAARNATAWLSPARRNGFA